MAPPRGRPRVSPSPRSHEPRPTAASLTRELGELLVASGAITEGQLREAMAYQRNGGMPLGDALVQLQLTDEVTVARAVAKQQGLPFVDLGKGRIKDEVLEMVPAELAREQGLMPIMMKDGKLVVAIDDPFKRIIADQLEFSIGAGGLCSGDRERPEAGPRSPLRPQR